MHFLFLFLALPASIVALPYLTNKNNYLALSRRQDDGADEIKKIAAIGDSYSAGIGAGERLGNILDITSFNDWRCSRYKSSYPMLVASELLNDDLTNFQFLSCSGALTHEVIEQVDSVNNDQDIILISSGGNDAEFAWLLNACIYQFASMTTFNSIAIEAGLVYLATKFPKVGEPALAWFNDHRGKLTRTCKEQIAESRRIIADKSFGEGIKTLVDKAKQKLKADGGKIYYTPYAQFFDDHMSEDDYCSKKEHTWSVFLSKIPDPGPIKNWQDTIILTNQLRKDLNDLVLAMNSEIKKVVADDDKVTFVDYERYFGEVGGRFCTHGVNKNEDERLPDLAFYPLNMQDPFGTSPMKRNDEGPTQGYVWPETFEGDITYMAYLGGDNITYKNFVKREEIGALLEGIYDEIKDHIPEVSVLPDGIGRIFHPTVLGHSIMAASVLWNIDADYAKSIGQDLGDESSEISDQCPLIPPSQCKDDASGVPSRFFDLAKNPPYLEFCEDFDSGKTDKENTQQDKATWAEHPDSPIEITLNWVPNKNARFCTMDCKHAIQTMVSGDCGRKGDNKDELSTSSSQDINCGVLSWEVDQPKEELGVAECWSLQFGNGGPQTEDWGAPRGAKEIDSEGGGTPVDAAVDKWCDDMNGRKLFDRESENVFYQRFGYSENGVADRYSFWLKALYRQGDGCPAEQEVIASNCKAAFTQGANDCNSNEGTRTEGFLIQGKGCIEYSLHIGEGMRDDSPPWEDPVVGYPPPQTALNPDAYTPWMLCGTQFPIGGGKGGQASIDDVNKVIDEWCESDGEWMGKGKFEKIGPLSLTAQVNGGNIYKDPAWCDPKNGFDDKNRDKDSCKYVIRKGVGTCNGNDFTSGDFNGFYWNYRCAWYSLTA